MKNHELNESKELLSEPKVELYLLSKEVMRSTTGGGHDGGFELKQGSPAPFGVPWICPASYKAAAEIKGGFWV